LSLPDLLGIIEGFERERSRFLVALGAIPLVNTSVEIGVPAISDKTKARPNQAPYLHTAILGV
jgi:hypothetical protein